MIAHGVTRLMKLEELYNGTLRRSKAPQIRKRINCFEEFDDADFIRRFRLSKASCHYLFEKLQSKLEPLSNRLVAGAVGYYQADDASTRLMGRSQKLFGIGRAISQSTCDYKLNIQDLVARWPGSSHDANIFNNSHLKSRLESGEFGDRLLVGDRGYGCTPYLMTPLANPRTAAERLYNESQIRTRNAIERCFGVWKRRFPVLSLGMRIATKTKVMVIIACGVLYKIALMSEDALPEPQLPIPEEVEGVDLAGDVPCRSRADLINEYFARL